MSSRTLRFCLGGAVLLGVTLAASVRAEPPVPAEAPGRLPVFLTAQSGISWKRSFGDHTLSNIVEGTGSGACVFDFDRDGKLDIYFPQGRWEKTVSDNRGRDLIDQLSNALYRNRGDQIISPYWLPTAPYVLNKHSDFDEDGGNLLGTWQHRMGSHERLSLQMYYDHSENQQDWLNLARLLGRMLRRSGLKRIALPAFYANLRIPNRIL